MEQSQHYWKIAARAFNRIWDTLSNYDRDIISNDTQKETQISKWFYSTVAQTAQSRFQSENYWMNDIESFKRSKHQEA